MMITAYFFLKHVHITCVILSLSLFILRFYWRIKESLQLPKKRPLHNLNAHHKPKIKARSKLCKGFKKWMHIAPHIIDTVLLLSALSLAWISEQIPFVQAWLGAKIIALIVYIYLGNLALKRAKTNSTRFITFILAMIVFAYIVSVALSKQPIPFKDL